MNEMHTLFAFAKPIKKNPPSPISSVCRCNLYTDIILIVFRNEPITHKCFGRFINPFDS